MTPPVVAVVNADREFLELMAELLRDEGYEAIIVHENATAYPILKQRMPALIVLELIITNPEAGWMVLNKLRLDPQTAHIPIIIASTATDLIARNEANLREKHCDILLKPFDLEEFLVMVAKYAPLSGRSI